ncbi:MAG TPA: hypothetical protein VKY24_07725 [Reyranella sp.]|nr:hypothetical protein [Reyranella sp.]
MRNAGQVRVKREGAERARRLARMMTTLDDKARLLAFAEELDAQADALEEAEGFAAIIIAPANDRGSKG